MKKRFFSILTALALCLSLLPTAVFAEGLIGQFQDPETVNLENSYNSGSTPTSGLIGGVGGTALTDSETTLTGGDYYLEGNVTLKQEEPLLITGAVTLNLNGHVLERLGSGSLIKVAGGGNLTLTDSNTTVQHNFTSDNYGVWTLNEESGTKVVNGGVIAGGTGTEGCGGGVYVESGGTFTMNGGSIVGCEVHAATTSVYGGGVYVAQGGSFVMNGGSIADCTTTGDGGGVYVASGGTMTMSGNANISGCTAADGAGIYLAGTLIANGGTVQNAVTVASGGKIETTSSESTTTFMGEVLNNGTIKGGTFKGEIRGMGEVTLGGSSGPVYIVNFTVDTVVYDKRCVTNGNLTISKPGDPVKAGYTFAGWVYNNTAWDFNKSVQENFNALEVLVADNKTITLTAMWNAKEYSITYELNGGTNHHDNPKEYRYGMGVSELFAPTRDGYTFDGWYLNKECTGDPITSISPGRDGNITLHAKWTQRYYNTVSDGTLSRSDGSKLADENGSVTAKARGTDGRVTGFTADGKSLDGIDLKGLDLRLTVEDTKLSLSPAAIRQLLNADAGSLTLDMPGADMTIPQEMLRDILKQLNGKDLDISLVSDEEAMIALTPEVMRWMSVMQEQGKFFSLSALTGEFSIDGEPLDWSQVSGVLDISLTREIPETEKKTGWQKENGRGFYYEDNGEQAKPKDPLLLEGPNHFELGYMVLDENGNWVLKGLEPPTILPLPDLRELTDYVGLRQDWDFPRSEDIIPEFKWVGDDLLLDFELPHFSTYLIVTRVAMPFDDVAEGSYYYDAVKWATDENITGGTDNTHFSPDAICTRAQLVTFLWRLAGEPVVNYLMPFTDVDESAWYAEAVRWAASEKIVEGTTASTFEPNATVSRAQAAAMIYRCAQAQGKGFTGAWMFLLPFTDVPEWAYESVAWCYMNGVITGVSETSFAPGNDCTRAQIVTFLWRAYAK